VNSFSTPRSIKVRIFNFVGLWRWRVSHWHYIFSGFCPSSIFVNEVWRFGNRFCFLLKTKKHLLLWTSQIELFCQCAMFFLVNSRWRPSPLLHFFHYSQKLCLSTSIMYSQTKERKLCLVCVCVCVCVCDVISWNKSRGKWRQSSADFLLLFIMCGARRWAL
jgi:hypothetical protein